MKNTVNNLMETLCTYEPKNIPVTSLYISPLNSGFGINEIDELCNSRSDQEICQIFLIQPISIDIFSKEIPFFDKSFIGLTGLDS